MIVLKPWQIALLILPLAAIALFLLFAAGVQIQAWGISWIWGLAIVLFVGWLWLLTKWTGTAIAQREEFSVDWQEFADKLPVQSGDGADKVRQVEVILKNVVQVSRADKPVWEDMQTFWQRCHGLVSAIAQVYYPDIKYPLLNIYIPQAYGLIRGTVDDLDRWMHGLSPLLNKISVGQAYEAYEKYGRFSPWLQKALQVWDWSLWIRNPAAALAKQASQSTSDRAKQQLLANLGQVAREYAFQHLAQRSVALYGNADLPLTDRFSPSSQQTQTLREILEQAQPIDEIQQKPVEILLVGRTGAGKSSLINSLFQEQLAAVDLLPNTTECQKFTWQDDIVLWDAPGYEQVDRPDLREQVLHLAASVDALILATPALEPALQMDADFLKAVQTRVENLPTMVAVTQVDRLRPVREWQTPYDWQFGTRPKEIAIRDAVLYRAEVLRDLCDRVIPVVTTDPTLGRAEWNVEALSNLLIENLDPARQARVARWTNSANVQATAAAKLIDRRAMNLSVGQDVASMLKSAGAGLLFQLRGMAALSVLLGNIPVEQVPAIVGKVLMVCDLYKLFKPNLNFFQDIDWSSLSPLLMKYSTSPQDDAWALGQALVEYLTQARKPEELQQRFDFYRQQRS
ncbi:GTPase family protein [Pseudanabaena sp. PCC 6802]|uniref:GTPase family protein n=1 Tax=Pseudanabaena sp. PCC 6802 TaxID=118173 RepID=UPI0003487AAA|nr:GTPase [Pseudanabaena sp. PCC 6802]